MTPMAHLFWGPQNPPETAAAFQGKLNGSQATLQTILARDRFAAKSSAAVEVQVPAVPLWSDGC